MQMKRNYGSASLLSFLFLGLSLLIQACSGGEVPGGNGDGGDGGDDGDGGDGGNGGNDPISLQIAADFGFGEVSSLSDFPLSVLETDLTPSTTDFQLFFRNIKLKKGTISKATFTLKKEATPSPRAYKNWIQKKRRDLKKERQVSSQNRSMQTKLSDRASALTSHGTESEHLALEKSIALDMKNDIDCSVDCTSEQEITDMFANLTNGETPRYKVTVASNFFEVGHTYTISLHLDIADGDVSTFDALGIWKIVDKIDAYKVFTRDFFNYMTQDSRASADCREAQIPPGEQANILGQMPDNAFINGVHDIASLRHNQDWYYTYENYVQAMQNYPEFMDNPDVEMQKIELAAFFAHVNQETGVDPNGTTLGGSCAIEEGFGVAIAPGQYEDLTFGPGGASTGYIGRGAHQLSWNYNYKNYGDTIGEDLVSNPDFITANPVIGLTGSLWFWNHTEPSYDGSQIPFKPSAHKVINLQWTPSANDLKAGRDPSKAFGITINIINGGRECNQASDLAKHRVQTFREALNKLGVTTLPAGFETDWTKQDCHDQANFADCPTNVAHPCTPPTNPYVATAATEKKRKDDNV